MVSNLYGLSETGPTHIDDPRESGWEPGSVGVSLDVNECRISEDGEILIKGENVFVGYHKNEKLYEKSVIEGWYNTGDLGEEKDGKLFFIDRKKDLIIKSGINIVPMEIEEVVHKHPAIIECVAVGKTSTIHGEEVAVVAVKNSDVDSDDLIGEIKRLCRESLSAYKVPNQIFFWDSIPKTPSKKLLRRKVRDLINSSQKDTDTSKKAYPHLNKTTKQIAGVNGFGRFGLHLIKYWLDRYDMACFTINYINDDTLSINQAIKVIRNDKKVVFKKYLIKKIGSKIRFSWGKGKMHEIQFTNVPKAQIPWLGEPELFFECSGRNTVKKNCMGFLTGETKHVIVSATSWDADKTLVYGFNHKEYDPKPNQVISYGSCTVNAFIPMANFINNNFGVVDADVNVIHNIQEYLLQKNYTLDRRFCTLEKSAPKMLEYLNKNNFTVKYTVVPYTGVSIFDFRFKLKNKFSLEQFLEKLEYEINEGELNGFYGLHEIDNGPEEHNCTSFSSVLIKEKIRLLNKQLYIFSYFDNENSVNRYYDLVNFIANKNKSSVLENSFMPKKNFGCFYWNLKLVDI